MRARVARSVPASRARACVRVRERGRTGVSACARIGPAPSQLPSKFTFGFCLYRYCIKISLTDPRCVYATEQRRVQAGRFGRQECPGKAVFRPLAGLGGPVSYPCPTPEDQRPTEAIFCCKKTTSEGR